MNKLRMLSCALVITAFVVGGNANALIDFKNVNNGAYNKVGRGKQFLGDHFYTGIAMVGAKRLSENDNVGKAVIETVGYVVDRHGQTNRLANNNTEKSSEEKENFLLDLGTNFAGNVMLRKYAHSAARDNGYTTKFVKGKLSANDDRLLGLGYYWNGLVSGAVDALAEPQVQTELAKFVLGSAWKAGSDSLKGSKSTSK
jgi:hypothetical protein